jgi:hypothetical protein
MQLEDAVGESAGGEVVCIGKSRYCPEAWTWEFG